MNNAKSIGIRRSCCIHMKETEDSEPELVEVNARLWAWHNTHDNGWRNLPSLILYLVEGIGIITVQRF